MKTILTIVFIVVGILVLGFVVFLFIPKPTQVTQPPVQFPNSGTSTSITGQTGTQAGSSSTSPTMTITSQNSTSPITVANFINNGTTIPDPSNAGEYYLTGSTAAEYAIKYDASSEFFTIALDSEPIGQARLDAQAFLQKSLGVGQSELCYLNYYLGTDDQTNTTFAGKNLGFSFCPGATALP